jgi:hypothetical protein
MKTWVVLFLALLAVGLAWGVTRDLFSQEKAVLSGKVVRVDLGTPMPKWLPATPPKYKAHLADGRIVDVATKNPHDLPIESDIVITKWMTPWGQVWYTQRD